MNAGFITIRYVFMNFFFLINDERENGDDASG